MISLDQVARYKISYPTLGAISNLWDKFKCLYVCINRWLMLVIRCAVRGPIVNFRSYDTTLVRLPVHRVTLTQGQQDC